MATRNVQIILETEQLEGILNVPDNAKGIVLFAHGSGSGRLSPRNQFVAQVLQQAGLATLLMDLLTAEEELIDDKTKQFRFDIQLLAERLIGCVKWLGSQHDVAKLSVGYFGASTGRQLLLWQPLNKAMRLKQ